VDPTLLLDLDGTLVDTVPDLAAALNRLMAGRALAPFSWAETKRMVGDGVSKLVERAFAARGLVPDRHAVADFMADYTAHISVGSRAYEGVRECLGTLSSDGWRLAVCTNKPEAAARRLLDDLGLGSFMTAVGGGDSFPVRKPDPAHVLATLKAAGGDRRSAVMGGDHANDVAAASGAGVPCVFAAWGYGTPAMAAGAACVAEDFPSLVDAARKLVGSD
jgi:phosphoglycolate phosphatase